MLCIAISHIKITTLQMNRRLRSALILLLLVVSSALTLFWWPPRPAARWDTSPHTLVVELASKRRLEGDTYYPIVQLWGDGRIVWRQMTNHGGNELFQEGYLSAEAMHQVVERIIAARAFDPMLDMGGGLVFQYLHLQLLSEQHCIHNTDDRMEAIYHADPTLVAWLSSGAGVPESRPIAGVILQSSCQ